MQSQQARDEAGNIWEIDAQGNPVRLVQPAAGGQQTVGTPDPRVALDRTAKELAIQAAMRAAARGPTQDQRDAVALERERLALEADKKKLNTVATGKPLRQGDGDKLEKEVGTYAALKDGLANFQDDFAGNAWTGDLENVAQGIIGTGTPGQRLWWSNFRATDNQIRNSLYGASLTAGEKQAYDQTTVNPRMRPEEIRKNIALRAEIVRKAMARKVARFKAGGYNPAEIDAAVGEYGADLTPNYKAEKRQDEKPPEFRPAAAMPPTRGGGPGDPGIDRSSTLELSPSDSPGSIDIPTGKTITKNDPAKAGVNAKIAAMVQKGATDEQILAYASKVGVDPANTTINQVLDWRRKHPEYKGSYSVNVDDIQVPMSRAQQLLNKIGSGPVGAGVMNAADTIVPLGKLSGNPEVTAAIMDSVSRANPKSSMVGRVAGGAVGAGATEVALGRLATTRLLANAPRLARAVANPVTADAAFGGAQGAMNAEPGSTASGTLAGILAGAGGGVAGRAVTRGVGNAAGGVRNAAIDELQTRGIPLTVGQALSQSGRIGQTVKSVEDAMTSLPIVGNMINARRTEGLREFNRSALDEALAPIGETAAGTVAEDGIARARNLVSQSYDDALGGVSMAGDAPFVGDMRNVFTRAARLPATMADNAGYSLNTRVGESFDPQGILSGRNFQQSLRGLRRDAGAVRNQPYGHDFGQVTREAEQALEALAGRQAPDVVPALGRANEAYGRVGIVRDAVNSARNGSRSGEGGLFMPSQLSDAASKNARRFGGTQATPDAPFFQLNEAARNVLPSRTPDSGSIGRLLVAGGITSGAAGGADYASGSGGNISASAASTLALLSVLGTRRGQQALVAGLTRRPDAIRNAADLIARNQRWGGVLGAGATVPLLTGP